MKKLNSEEGSTYKVVSEFGNYGIKSADLTYFISVHHKENQRVIANDIEPSCLSCNHCKRHSQDSESPMTMMIVIADAVKCMAVSCVDDLWPKAKTSSRFDEYIEYLGHQADLINKEVVVEDNKIKLKREVNKEFGSW